MDNQYTIQFNPKLPKLSKNEQAVLKLLVEAGRLIAPIFAEQEKLFEENGSFYPKGTSKAEIDQAIKENPAILSPYTVVEKIDGKIVAIPYHIKYAQLLKPVIEKLNRASRITDSREFSRFLRLQAKALLEGTYEAAIAASIKTKTYILDVYIIPVEHNDDAVFFAKAAYQAWVGVLDIEGTQRLNSYKSTVLSVSRRSLLPHERIDSPHPVKTKTIDEVLLAGFVAKSKFVGLIVPMNFALVAKYGSEFTIFNQVNNLRLKEQILPTFKKIFSPAFRKEFTIEDLRRGSLRYVALHELAHNYLYYKNATQNLQDLFAVIYELAATLLGMRIAGSLLLQERINNKQLESMIVAFMARSVDLTRQSEKNSTMINYAIGGTIFINFMLESGALKQKGGITIANFMKIFVSVHELSYIVEHLLASGTRQEAETFINKYGQIS